MSKALKGSQLATYFAEKASQLDELKKSTLQSYTAKAVGSKSGLDFMRGVKMAQGTGGEEELRKKSEKRSEGIHRAIKKLTEAKTPAQKNDFKRVMAGAMSRDEYNQKHGLGKYANKSAKSKLDPTGVYHNLIKTTNEEITPVQSAAARQKLKQIEKSGTKKSQALYDKLVRIANANKQVKEGHVPDDRGRYISDADKRTLGKLADLMQKERPKKKPETPEEIKQSVKEESQLDEISTAAKQNYINAAALDVARTGNMLGRAQVGKSKTSASTSGKRIEKRLQGIATATSKLTKEDVEQIDEVSDELAMKVGMARTANVKKAGDEYRKTAFQGDDVRKTALDKLKAAEAKRDKGGKVQIARSDRKLKSFLKQHAEKMAARSPEQVKKDTEAEIADKHKNYKERGWTLD